MTSKTDFICRLWFSRSFLIDGSDSTAAGFLCSIEQSIHKLDGASMKKRKKEKELLHQFQKQILTWFLRSISL